MKIAVITIAGFAALFSMGQVAAADGKAVFDKTCAGCHAAMSPKLTGEKAKWEPLLKQGKAALAASVIKGKGAMPPKGGAASDADVKAAVDYMVTQIK
jgi:cytochrome c5